MKAGDGTTAWTSLSYINVVNSTNAAIADESKTADKLTNGLVVKDTTGKTVTFDGSSSVDLSGGIYYAVSAGTANNALAATTADTANKTKNAITFKNKSNAAVSFDGTTAVDLSNGIYYAETANTAATATTATTTTSTTNDDAGNKISTSYFKIDGSNAMTGPLVLNASSNSFLYAGDKFNFAGNSLATGNVYINYKSANVIKDYMLCNGDNAGTLAEVKMSNFVGNWNGHAWDEISTTYATKFDMDAKIGDIETALKTIQGGSTDKIAAAMIQRDATSIDIPSGTTKIGDYAFYFMTKLTSATIPNSVTSIGSGVFNGCTSLKSITIPSSVTAIGSNTFNGCTALTSITINKASGSITGSPWGALTTCTITYTG